MNKDDLMRLLNMPDNELVNYAISTVNLTEKEKKTLNYVFRYGHTVDETAELLQMSPASVARYKKTAIDKCLQVFEGKEWVKKILR